VKEGFDQKNASLAMHYAPVKQNISPTGRKPAKHGLSGSQPPSQVGKLSLANFL